MSAEMWYVGDGETYNKRQIYMVDGEYHGSVAVVDNEDDAGLIARDHNIAPKIAEALRLVLPLAKAYLKSAPTHPDNGKIADATDALAQWDKP